MEDLRNIAIIAHVDHGKTTLVDALLRQSGLFHARQDVAERVMDSNALERERGITILSKCASVTWSDTRINIVDTPGHADFGGEVERILSMVDGVLLLVDAAEGPMPQTKFVTQKALRLGLRPILVVNKVDKPDARPDAVVDEVFDLFVSLDAHEDQLDFPILFASAKDGWASTDWQDKTENMQVLFDKILNHVPAPRAAEGPLTMLVSTLESDPYLGRLLTGRIYAGEIRANKTYKALSRDGKPVEETRVTKILGFRGLERVPLEVAQAGDIVSAAGFEEATVSHTICAPGVKDSLPADPVDPPTLAMIFSVNDSPLAGRTGTKLTSRQIQARLWAEAEGNVAIRVAETDQAEAFEVAGRGELQLGVLIETMRREGFELSISRPRVITRKNPETGALEEPYEDVIIDVDEDHAGTVVEALNERKARLEDMRPSGGGKQRLRFLAPSRGLIGYHDRFMTETRGTGVMNRLFREYGPHAGPIEGRRNGVLVSNGQGRAVPFALWNLEERGELFITPGTDVYQGMIIGEHSRGNDLDVNPLKTKQLTNIRAAGSDEAVRLSPPRDISLEQALAYINDDELVEVVPGAIRLRKRLLDPVDRKREERRKEKA